MFVLGAVLSTGTGELFSHLHLGHPRRHTPDKRGSLQCGLGFCGGFWNLITERLMRFYVWRKDKLYKFRDKWATLLRAESMVMPVVVLFLHMRALFSLSNSIMVASLSCTLKKKIIFFFFLGTYGNPGKFYLIHLFIPVSVVIEPSERDWVLLSKWEGLSVSEAHLSLAAWFCRNSALGEYLWVHCTYTLSVGWRTKSEGGLWN